MPLQFYTDAIDKRTAPNFCKMQRECFILLLRDVATSRSRLRSILVIDTAHIVSQTEGDYFMRKTMRMVFAGVLVLAVGIYGNNAIAQDSNERKKAIVNALVASGAEIMNVKNAPFSGEMVCESIQTLADGNRIVNRTSTIFYRDREGRIRRESSVKIRDANTGEYKEHKMIQVSDPFGGQNFTLDPQNLTAQKFTTSPRPMKEIEGIRTFQYANAGGIPNPTVIARSNVCGPRLVAPVGGVLPNAGASVGPNVETKNESLGTHVIEGVAAEGTRITHTIPAGSINNERPIEIIYDRWYSRELQLDVLIKLADPRSGESIQQLTNINRGEPDPALFEIPPDYTVQEFKKSIMRSGEAAKADLLRDKVDKPAEGSDKRVAVGGVQPMSASLRPTILYKEKGKYTEEARNNRIEGTVVLNVVFTADGRITSIRVLRGLPDGLTEKAIEAALKVRFNPAVKNGVPVSVRGNLEFTFVLDK
jgi:TonB family protein